MRRHFLYALLACSFIASATVKADTSSAPRSGVTAQEDELSRDGIRTVINLYFRGHATGDASHMRSAFLPTAHIEGMREGKFTSWTVDEYCALFSGKPAPDEQTRVRTIDFIDVSGDSGTAKATLDHGTSMATDYFLLVNIGGEWKIANKIYHWQKNDSRNR